MHELSIMDNILEIACRRAAEHNASRIHRITLRIGDLSGVALDALEFAFEILRSDTPAAEAELVVDRVPMICECAECGGRYEPADPLAGCPACGALRSRVVQGKELELISMEVS